MRRPIVLCVALAACRGPGALSPEDAPGDGGPRWLGEVDALKEPFADGTGQIVFYGLYGGFSVNGPPEAPFSCGTERVRSGDCCFSPPADPDLDAGVDVGDLLLDDVTQGVSLDDVPFAAQQAPSYIDGWLDTPAWEPGDVLRVANAGEEGPIFTVETSAPDDPEGVVPDAGSGSSVVVATDSDWTVRWRPEAGSRMGLHLEAEDTARRKYGAIDCDADDALGTLTVPAALLAHFAPGAFCTGSCYLVRRRLGSSATPSAEVVFSVGSMAALPLVLYR